MSVPRAGAGRHVSYSGTRPAAENGKKNVKENDATEEQVPGEDLSIDPNPTSFLGDNSKNDWSRSYFGLSVEPFPKEVADILQASLDPADIEIKPGRVFFKRASNMW